MKKKLKLNYDEFDPEFKDLTSEIIYTNNSISIIFHKYPTHVSTYIPKTSKGKFNYQKINGQTSFKFTKGIIFKTLHEVYANQIKQHDLERLKEGLTAFLPIKIKMTWYTIPNHEAVKILNNKLAYPNVEESITYEPSFDCDNQYPYFKAFQDTLTKDLSLLPEDTVKYVPNSGEIQYIPVDNFNKRALVFTITPCKSNLKSIWEQIFKFWRK